MTQILALVAVLVLLFGCEFKVSYQIDGEAHQVVLNPEKSGDGQ
jgi:hypothetical protein